MSRLRRLAGSAKRRLQGNRPPPQAGKPIYRLTPEGAVRGRALLSIATQVYERLLQGEPLDKTHVAAWQNFNISRTFLDLGFQVDVMSWDDQQTRPPGPYDVLIDVISNLERLAEFGNDNAVKILHPMFAHWAVHNANNAARHADMLRRMDQGRYMVTGKEEDRGAFKVPTLREVARTAPYMHDGSLATLEDVVDFYDRGGNRNPTLDSELHPLQLAAGEKRALIAFLRSLSGHIQEGL